MKLARNTLLVSICLTVCPDVYLTLVAHGIKVWGKSWRTAAVGRLMIRRSCGWNRSMAVSFRIGKARLKMMWWSCWRSQYQNGRWYIFVVF